MKVQINKLSNDAKVNINGNIIDLVATKIFQPIQSKDGSAEVIYDTDISVEYPSGYTAIVVPTNNITASSFVQPTSIIKSGDKVRVAFKLNATFPLIYNVGDVIGHMVFVQTPTIETTIMEYVEELTKNGAEETTSNTEVEGESETEPTGNIPG